MKKYKYIGVNKKGEKVTGTLEAVSNDEVAGILLETGVSPIKINEQMEFLTFLQPSIYNQGVPTKEKVIFLREFATMISAGLALDDSLDVASAQTSHKIFKSILEEATREIRAGSSLAGAFGKFPKVFTPIEVNLIKAGEVSGKIDIILSRLADDVEKQTILQGKVKGALTYPVLVLGIAFVVVVIIIIKLVPAMLALYEGFGSSTLPGPTELLVQVSNLFTNYGIELIIVAGAIYLITKYYTATPNGGLVVDTNLLRLPIVGELISKYQLVTFIKTYSMLLTSGIPVINSLNLVGESLGNKRYAKIIKETSKDVEKGVSLADALGRYPQVPAILWRSIQVGEETGKTEEILDKIGKYFEQEVDDKVTNLTRLLEPMLLVVLGSIVGFIAVAIYLPIYNFSSVINNSGLLLPFIRLITTFHL